MTVALPVQLQFLVVLFSTWIARGQGQAIEYLRAENRVLRARLGRKRLRFTDAERRLLAEKGKPLGRTRLGEFASLATPETILRWYRQKVAASTTRVVPASVPAVQAPAGTRSSNC